MSLFRAVVLPVAMVTGLLGCSKTAPTEVDEATETLKPVPEVVAIQEIVTPEPTVLEPETKPEMAAEVPAEDWLIVPGERVGKITAISSEADLIAAYGAKNVKDTEFDLGEGEVEMGTGIFLDDDTKALRILWADPEKKLNPISIEFFGDKSVWKTSEGISLGTPISVVQKLNGKPFKLYGFGWDYGGMVADSNAGAIKGMPHEDPEKGHMPVTLSLRFEPDYENKSNLSDDKITEISGDGEFSSDHPVMQEIDPVVRTIHVSFSESDE